MNSLSQVIEALKAAKSVAIISHVNPEADTLGSALAAYFILRDLGKEVAIYNADPVPKRLLLLPGAKEVIHSDRIARRFDVYLVLDTSDPERTGGLLDGLPPQSLVINIDHHMTNTHFGSLNWVDEMASSVGEMVYQLFKEMKAPISAEAATNLYAAIHTDTGSFRFSNTTSSSLRAAAELIELGAKAEEVAEQLYEQQDVRVVRFLGKLLAGMEQSEDGAIAYLVVRHSDLEAAGIGAEETEGFINYPRSLKGVKVALVFNEVSPGVVKVSFRSKGQVDVAKIAGIFQGGGHRNAAGCTTSGSLAEVMEKVLAEVRSTLHAGGWVHCG